MPTRNLPIGCRRSGLRIGHAGAVEDRSNYDRLGDLEPSLRILLNEWDPIGVYDAELDFPADEYDSLLGPLLSRLQRGEDGVAIGEFLWNEVRDHYGLDPERSRPDIFAERVVVWFRAQS
jgi:hypothetical protein